jgi:LysR family transcriptional regulator, chromosome initiation inhibitor
VPLGTMRYLAIASPGFIAEHWKGRADGLDRASFSQVPFLVFNRKDDMQHQWVSRAFGVRGPRLRERFVPSSEAYVRAALMGWGVGVAPEIQVRGLIDSGALVSLRPEVTLAVRLFWHQWKLAPDGAQPTPRLAMLDRIGAALVEGARGAFETSRARLPAPGGVSGRRRA